MQLETLFSRWVERMRAESPDIVAILCHGSYARGEPLLHSDLDLDLLFESPPTVEYRSAFDELSADRLLHVTIAQYSLEGWIAQWDEWAESETWAFYLPARQVARLLWATPEARAALEGRVTLDLAASPQLQDLLEGMAKVRNAWEGADELGVRLAAQDMALRIPALVGLIHPTAPVDTRRAALSAALEMPVAIPGYRDDFLLCMGLSGDANTVADVHAAALRLASGVVGLLEARPELTVGVVELGLTDALRDGLARRLITQVRAQD